MTTPRGNRDKGRGNIIQGFEIFLKRQEALTQQQSEVAAAMRAAADQMALSSRSSDSFNAGDIVAGVINGMQFLNNNAPTGGGTLGTGGSQGGQPTGNRPTFNGNGKRRPRHQQQASNQGQGNLGSPPNQDQPGAGPDNPPGVNSPGNTVGRGRIIGSYSNKFHGQGLSGLRSAAANWLHENKGAGSGSFFQDHYDSAGNHVGVMETDQMGNQVMRATTDGKLPEDLAAAATRGRVSGAASSLAAGGGIRALASRSLYGAALVGAYEVTDKVSKTITDQRSKNAQYQAIYGGTNMAGMGQRFYEKGFELDQQFGGGLTNEDARTAFRGVSALGLQGDRRTQDLNFMTDAYKKMGTSVADSLQLVTTATQNFNVSMAGISDSLENVRKAASQSGVSGQLATQIFSQNYSSYSKAAPGAGIANTAGITSGFLAGMGTSSASNIDMNGMFSDANVNIMASQSGMTRSEFIANGSTNSDIFTEAVARRLTTVLNNLIPKNVQDYIKKQNQSSTPNEQVANTIALDIMKKFKINGRTLAAAFMNLGIASPEGGMLDDTTAVTLAVYSILKGNLGKTNEDRYKQDTGKQGTDRNPVLALANQEIGSGEMVTIKTKNGYQVMSLAAATMAAPDQIAKGTAVVTATGATVKDTLGGASETNYQGQDTTDASSSTLAENVQKNRFISGIGGLPSTLKAIGTAKSLEQYNADEAQRATGQGVGSAGNVTISATPELRRYFNFDGSGDTAKAAASGTPQQPR